LDLQPLRCQRRLLQDIQNTRRKKAVLHLNGGNIEGQHHMIRPSHRILAGAAQQSLEKRRDEARFLRDGDEDVWSNVLAIATLPAGKILEPENATCPQNDQRLIEGRNWLSLDGLPQFPVELGTPVDLRLHVRVEQDAIVRSLGLCLVESN